MEKTVAEKHPDNHQKEADGAAGNQGCVYGTFQIAEPLGTKQLRREHRAADITAKGKRKEDQCNLVTVSDGCQSIVTNEFPCHEAVGNVIQLLKEDTAEKRKAELTQNIRRFPDGQVFVHGTSPQTRLSTACAITSTAPSIPQKAEEIIRS